MPVTQKLSSLTMRQSTQRGDYSESNDKEGSKVEDDQTLVALTVLTRLAQRRQAARSWLKAALHGRLETLGEVAFEAAIGIGEPIGKLLAEESESASEQTASNLLSLSEKEPYDNSLHLLEMRRSLLEKRVASLRERDAIGAAAWERAEFARATANLSAALSKAGQPERGLLLAYDALDAFLDLADTDENFRPDVIIGLYNLGIAHSRLGPMEDALWYYSQAADLWRILMPWQRDRSFLATILTQWASCLEEQRRDEAIALIREAIQIWRTLPARNNAQLGHLATALGVLSDLHASSGNFSEAFEVSQEGSAIYHELAAERPDIFLPQYAFSLGQISLRLDDLGRTEEALQLVEKEDALWRSLKEINSAFSSLLAGSLSIRATLLESLDRSVEALEACREAVRLRQELVVKQPELTAEDFTWELHNLRDILSTLNSPVDEVIAIEEETLSLVLPEALKYPGEMLPAIVLLKQEYLESSEHCRLEPNSEILRLVQEVETRAHALRSEEGRSPKI